MLKTLAHLGLPALLLMAGPVDAADSGADQCAALDHMLAQARTEFPTLKQSKLDAEHCSVVTNEFRCKWGFPDDQFGAAQTQAERLTKCTVALAGVKALGKKRAEQAFQLNPETIVYLSGPTMDSGSGEWTDALRIVSTAD